MQCIWLQISAKLCIGVAFALLVDAHRPDAICTCIGEPEVKLSQRDYVLLLVVRLLHEKASPPGPSRLTTGDVFTFRVTPHAGSTSRAAPMLRHSTIASGVFAFARILVTRSGEAQM